MVPGEPSPALRICFFNRSYDPDLGATGQLLTELAEDLAQKHGCQVTIVVGPPSRSEHHHGVKVLRAWGTAFRPTRFTGRAVNYLTYFLSACVVGLFIRKQDIVISLTDPPIIGLAGLLTARLSGAKFVFLCEDLFPEVASLLQDFRSGWVDRLLQGISRFLVRKSDRIVALGETMRQRLIDGKGADPRKIVVIHNWADCSSIVPAPKENPFSLTHGLENHFVVMHSGNMGLSQNLDTLLEAADLLRAHPAIVVVLVGDGVKRSALESRARIMGLANIRFIPYQPKQNLRESFAAADVFVVSLKKGLAGCIVPSKLYGILAAGRPFIAAVEKTCEAALIAQQRACGLQAEPGNAADLAEKILSLYKDRALAQRMGQNARQAALRFDRPRAVQAYVDMFRDLKR